MSYNRQYYVNIIQLLQAQGFTSHTIANSIGISPAVLNNFLAHQQTLPQSAKHFLRFYAEHRQPLKKVSTDKTMCLTLDTFYVANCLIAENILTEHSEAEITPKVIQTLASVLTVLELNTLLKTITCPAERTQLHAAIAKFKREITL